MDELQSLADLLDLQAVDSKIDRLLHERGAMPELAAYRNAHEEAETARTELKAVEDEMRSVNRELDKAEGELEILEDKIYREEQRLFAGGMSARETEHLRNETISLRKQKGTMEESVLEFLDKRESLEAELNESQETVEAKNGHEQELESTVAQAWKRIDAEIARREARKAEIVPIIPSDLIEMYERLRQTKQGVAVGALVDGVCGGCHLKMSAAEQIEAKSDSPPRCIHCRRIVVP